MVRVMARIVAKSESAPVVESALRELVVHTRKEPGCLSYELFRRSDAPHMFVTVEQWRDGAAADAHMSTPHVAAAIAAVGAHLASAPEIDRYEQLC